MLTKILPKIAGLAALVLLTACAPEVSSSLYLSDLGKAIKDRTPVVVPAVLRIPQGSEDECNKDMQLLITNLSAIAPTTGKGKCIDKNGDTLAEIETSLVIVRADQAGEVPQPNLFVVELTNEDNGTNLTLHLLKPIGEIVTAMSAGQDSVSTDFDPTVFLLRIENDIEDPALLEPDHVFFDDEPALGPDQTVTLERRRGVEVRFSDVASVVVERGGSYRFATLHDPL